MGLELLFLGTGTSAGVPMIGCHCAVCESDDPRDRRTRPSALIRWADPALAQPAGSAPVARQVLIDSSPDVREQAVRERIDWIDAVMYTHNHADHIFGIDDLRRFNAVMETPLDIYAEPRVLEALGGMFPYIFNAAANINSSFVPQLIAHALHVGQPVQLYGTQWTAIRLMHGRLPVVGYRVDFAGQSIAYCTDVSTIPPETYKQLEGLDVLVLDALRKRHHPTHLTVDQALDVVESVQPGRAYFTHIAHELSHAQVDAELPEHVSLAYDGLKVQIGE